MKKFLVSTIFCSLAAAVSPMAAQTFEIGGKPSKTQSEPARAAEKKSGQAARPAIGWGSSIEVGRMARAAQQALRRGNHSQAATFAERAVKSAPNNASLWFLLGYTSRLAGRYQQSVSAYNRGLQMSPGSLEGLSGLAQTYARMGRMEDAKRLVMQVIAKKPQPHTLLMAGELYLRSGDVRGGLNLLERSEKMKPSSHGELLMATAYLKLKQPERAKELLDRARKRDPKNAAIFRAVANYHREQREYDQAIAILKGAPRKTPDILSDLGWTYELAGMRQESAATYLQAADAAKQNVSLQLSAAQAQLRIGDRHKANVLLARAQALNGDHYRLHAIRAGMAKDDGKTEEAIREYNIAMRNMPEVVPEGRLYPILMRISLAELYKETGNEAASKEHLAAAEQMASALQIEGPARAEFLRVRASIKTGFGDLAAAEADLKEALTIDPNSQPVVLQYANLLWRTKRKEEARQLYANILERDPKNRFALESIGYISRDMGDRKAAEMYFTRMAQAYPDDYIPHLALGDMFTTAKQYDRALAAYEEAYKRNQKVAVVIANAANAAIETRKFELANGWIARATGAMLDDARVMRERERALFHAGNFLESARLGYKVLERLPEDRNASVYLAYALYNLGRYDEVLSLVSRYEQVLPQEANFPLLAGHVHKQHQLLDESVEDYSRAIELSPKMVDAYVNRGYVLTDLQNAEAALQDFESALNIQKNNGIAHLGRALAHLQLRQGRQALESVDTAEKILGQSGATHMARATAHRQLRQLDKAEKEYRLALAYAPDDFKLHMGLAGTLFNLRRYRESIQSLGEAMRLSPDDPAIYAQLAHAHAHLGDRQATYEYIRLAEEHAENQSEIMMNTGGALLALGEDDAAMERFTLALEAPDANRVEARLAIARVFVQRREWPDARQQVALAFAESRVGEAQPVTTDNLIEAGNVFLAIQEFGLARTYFEKAREAGASESVTAIGLANAYLAQGDDVHAETELSKLGDPAEFEKDYSYMLAMAQLYRQRSDRRALGAFARANALAPDGSSDVIERNLLDLAGEHGYQLNRRFSVQSSFNAEPLFEDATIYQLDAQMLGVAGGDTTLMPSPRSSYETRIASGWRYHNNSLPPVGGFFQVRNARGEISLPSEFLIVQRNTYDYSLNQSINPVLRLGQEYVAFTGGIQFTWRRDRNSPFVIDQNLWRPFVYFSTSSFFNWVTVRGAAFTERGPYVHRDLKSRELGASLELTVGRPWGNTALVTGWRGRDLQYDPLIREFFQTASYAGVRQRFGRKFTVGVLGEYIRSWRVQNRTYTLAQAMRPGVEFEYQANSRWRVDGNFFMTRGQGFHAYDNMQGGFFISYTKPVRRLYQDELGEVPVEYPLRFSFGIEHQAFSNFAGRGQSDFRPVIRLTLF